MISIINKYLEEIVANKPKFKEYHLNMLNKYKETFNGTPQQWKDFKYELCSKNIQYFETTIMAEYNKKRNQLRENMLKKLFQKSKFVPYKRGYDIFKIAWEYAENNVSKDYAINELETKGYNSEVIDAYLDIENDYSRVIEYAQEGTNVK